MSADTIAAFKAEILAECQQMINRAMRGINCTCQKGSSSTTDRLRDLVVQALLPEPIEPGAAEHLEFQCGYVEEERDTE